MRNFIRVYLAFVLCLLVFISNAYSSSGKSSKEILDNGMTVLISEIPQNPMVSIYVLIKAGSATEGKFLGTGITHFLEHMLFKGTEKRGVGEIAAQIQALGGEINAATSKDYTMYTVTVPAEAFDTALDILADIMMNTKFEEVEFLKERDVILNEMRLHKDNPDREIAELESKSMYTLHPYQNPVIGYESLFKELTKDNLVEYYKTFYVPNNMVMSVAGNVEAEKALPKIRNIFKDFRRQVSIPRNLPKEPQQISPRRSEVQYPTDLTRMYISFPTVSLLDQDLFALDVLAKILGQGRSSRLFLDVYKKQNLVHSIWASSYTPIDSGSFSIGCVLNQENVEAAILSINNEIESVKKKGVTQKEIEKAKRQVLSEYIFGSQTTAQVAYLNATDEAFAGDYQFAQKYVEAIKKVENADIVNVANKYLTDQKRNIVILKPLEKEQSSKKEISDEKKVLDIKKFTLDNGLTVLLKEDHAFPIVSMRIVLNGGLVEEKEELNGLSKMTSELWLKGTKKYKANDIAELSEAKGMSVDSYAGKFSYGLNLEFLSEDINLAFDLAEDLIKNPLFDKGEMIKVKQDMLADLKVSDDSIFDYTSRYLHKMLFSEHPLRMDKDGTPQSIERITQMDIKNFYEAFTAPRNMVISIFGDIDSSAALKMAKDTFGSLKDKSIVLGNFSQAPLSGTEEKEIFMDKSQAMVMFGFHGVDMKNDDRYGLDVLMSILGSSFSGRLFSSIREQLGHAYTLGAYSSPGKGAGMIGIYVLTDEGSLDAVKKIVRDEIQKIQSTPVSDKELNDIKMYLKGTFKADNQTNSSLSFTSSLDELYGFGFDKYKHYDEVIDAVTKEDISSLAGKYLNLDRMAVVVTEPKK